MKLIFAYLFFCTSLVGNNLGYSQVLNHPLAPKDTIEFEYAFANLRGSYSYTIYYENRSKADFRDIMKFKSGKGHVTSYDSIMAIHFKLIRYMSDNGFDLLSRQSVKGEKIDLFGNDIEYEFVFRTAKKKN
jgi:hypothetical protein